MLFTFNATSIAVWSLIGAFVVALLAFCLWRFLYKGKLPIRKRTVNELKSSMATYQIALGLSEVAKYKTMANVLVKNRFAKTNFSLFPVISYHNGCFFIISNLLDGSDVPIVVGKLGDKLDAWKIGKKGNSLPCIDWSFSSYITMTRYLESLDRDIHVVRIVPYIGDVSFAKRSADFHFVPLELLYEKIIDFSSNHDCKDPLVLERVFNELSKQNLFVGKGSVPKRLLRSLIE